LRRRVGRPLARAPRSVIGYHGCSTEAAQRILSAQRFIRSENSYDWLGVGVYFWEYGPFRAAEWAKTRFNEDAAVLQATIRLGRCLNLLDPRHYGGLLRAYELAVAEFARRDVPLLKNRRGAHFLDRLIIESYCEDEAIVAGEGYSTVRGCYPEGAPVFPGSRILRETHVQIAVRINSCISQLRQISLEQIDTGNQGGI